MKNYTSEVDSRIKRYEEEQKQKMVAVFSDTRKTYNDGLAYAKNEIQRAKQMTSFNYEILCFKNDGIFQLNKAIEEVYGVAAAKKDDTPSAEDNVNTIDIELADGTRYKVPYGDIELEELGEGAKISIGYDSATNILHVRGKCQFRYSSIMDDIIDKTKELIANNSIYKGQAIEIVELDAPKLLPLDGIDKQLMVLSEEAEYELRPLRSRIFKSEECVKKGISLKYECLLEGPYGL
mgnify:CR=1 FL=1